MTTTPHLPLQLSVTTLADQYEQLKTDNQVVIVEQSPLEVFVSQHIPDALHLDFKRLQAQGGESPGMLPNIQQLQDVFSELGITPNTHIIASDHEGGGWAGRLIWILDCIGHTRYSYLDGGLNAWLHHGFACDSGQAATPAPSHYPIEHINSQPTIELAELQTRLGDDDFAVWDARSLGEYLGEKAISSRAGHIPGAVHYEWTQAMDMDNGLALRPLDTLRCELDAIGINPTKDVVTHCQSHHRSGLTYVIGKLIGLNIRAYAGSWSQWGNHPDTPITTGNAP